MKRETLLDKYMQGKLSDTERKQFDMLLENDSSFREEVAFQNDVKRAVTAEEDDDFRVLMNEFDSEAPQKTPRGKKTFTRWLVAASIALLAGLTYFVAFESHSPQDLASDYFTPYRNVVHPIERGEHSEDKKTQAFSAYTSGRYSEAMPLFHQLFQEDGTPYLLFYEANTLMQLDRAKEAVPLLQEHMATDDSLADKSAWYLALAYLQLDNIDKAKELLRQIVAEGDYKAGEAQELLEQL